VQVAVAQAVNPALCLLAQLFLFVVALRYSQSVD
jgi:hypothetical protein